MTSVGDWFSFGGRITRAQYWLWYVLVAVVMQLAVALIALLAMLAGPACTPAPSP